MHSRLFIIIFLLHLPPLYSMDAISDGEQAEKPEEALLSPEQQEELRKTLKFNELKKIGQQLLSDPIKEAWGRLSRSYKNQLFIAEWDRQNKRWKYTPFCQKTIGGPFANLSIPEDLANKISNANDRDLFFELIKEDKLDRAKLKNALQSLDTDHQQGCILYVSPLTKEEAVETNQTNLRMITLGELAQLKEQLEKGELVAPAHSFDASYATP